MSRFNLSAWAVRETAITRFLILAVALAGSWAFFALGRAEDPSFTVKAVTVTAIWPGATAQQMQDLVADPLEKPLQELRWYYYSQSFTRAGYAYITLRLRDDTPPDEVQDEFYQARKKIADAARVLPAGVRGPFVDDEYSDVFFALYALQGDALPYRQQVALAESLRQQLSRVNGVQKVRITGERAEKLYVDLPWERVATLGVAPQAVFAAISAHSAVTPGGTVHAAGPDIPLRTAAPNPDADALANIAVVAGDRSLRLADIATIYRELDDPPSAFIRHDGEPALLLGVVMRAGHNGLQLGRELTRVSTELQAQLPSGVQLREVTNQSRNIRAAVDEFMLKFCIALSVVLVVTLLSLGWRTGLVVVAAVPLTLSAVFVVMLLTDRVFDRITLGALVLSLGLLVDDAIIAVEMMVVRMEQGVDRVAAAAHAWSVTAAPMLAGTLLTIIGLMPVGFARSSAGEYAGNIFWIVGFSLLASWLVAVVFTPFLGVRLLPAHAVAAQPAATPYGGRPYRWLRRSIAVSIAHRWSVTAVVLGAFVLSVAGMAVVKKQFFPQSNRPELIVELHLPHGSGIATTASASQSIESWLLTQPQVERVTAYVGQGAPRFFLSLNPELPDPAFAKIIVLTPDAEAREALKLALRKALAQGLASQAEVRVTQLLFGPPVPYPVGYRVIGPDVQQLRRIASQLESLMRANPHTRNVRHDWGEEAPLLHWHSDVARLGQLGLDPQTLAQQLQFFSSGITVGSLRDGNREVEIIARAVGYDRQDPSALQTLSVVNAQGARLPLSQAAQAEWRSEAPILRRRNREPYLSVDADIDERLQPPQVTAELAPDIERLRQQLPPGYRIDTTGAVEESAIANRALAAVFPVMLLLLLTVIMLQVRSFAAMWMVFLTAPLGLIGAVPALLISGAPFGFNAILGLIGLAGILMRNTLILVGQIDDNRASGMSREDAVVEATVQRARPVVLTALAAVLAFIPLTSSSFWGAMAITLIGGTAVGTALTLLFLPSLYAITYRLRKNR